MIYSLFKYFNCGCLSVYLSGYTYQLCATA